MKNRKWLFLSMASSLLIFGSLFAIWPTGASENKETTSTPSAPSQEKPLVGGFYNNGAASISGLTATGPQLNAAADLVPDTKGNVQANKAFVADADGNISFPVGAGILPNSKLLKWRTALAKVQAGTADAKILMIGDSTTLGFGSGAAPLVDGSASAQLIKHFNNRFKADIAAQGLGANCTANPDTTRWTMNSGWSVVSGAGFGNGGVVMNASNTNACIYAPTGGASYDRFDIYYGVYPGGTGFTAQATGGTATPVDTGNQGWPERILKITISGTAGTSNTLTITPNTQPAYAHIFGIEAWSSTAKRVRVANAGVGMSMTTGWADNSPSGSLAAIKKYAPDLTIINLGINDAAHGPLSAATFNANLQAICAACEISGDVIIQTMYPSGDSTAHGYELEYVGEMRKIAAARGCGLFDYWSSLAGVHATPFSSGDDWHPNTAGYADQGNSLFNLLMQ
jgi:lysophospholipase L1-like esterase